LSYEEMRLTSSERELLRSYASLPDAEVWRRADGARDPLAWLEWEGRWFARLQAWNAAGQVDPEPVLRYPEWVKVTYEERRRPRTQNKREERSTRAYPSDLDLARAAAEEHSSAYWRERK
jgi:hypothetical protein